MYMIGHADEKRPLTDIFCLILGLVFSAVMIILAASLFNYSKSMIK
jgi:hypothetical protein